VRWGSQGRTLVAGTGFAAGQAPRATYFYSGAAEVEVGGAKWKLKREGNYPWEGRVKLVLQTETRNAKLKTVFVRIPGWGRNEPLPGDLYRFADPTVAAPTLAVNGQAVALRNVPKNGFVCLARDWRSGDVIELDLPMPLRHVIAHSNVKKCAGKVVLERGPIVQCFDGGDHDGRVLDPAMPAGAAFVPRRRPDFLGVGTVLEGELIRAGGRIRATAIP